MFTGLVQATARLTRSEARPFGHRVRFGHALGRFDVGESISVSGACVTVVDSDEATFAVELTTETLERTTLALLAPGASVNLERSLRVGDRLGGHWVTGHVDAVVEALAVEPQGDAARVRVALPVALARFVAPKGSVALDGVSLTVNAVGADWFELMLIPHTAKVTTLGALAAGTRLNMEVDLLARYAVRASEEARA
ncbi:MAG TPA: riboflavin synthase [Polyangiaceae bacterium]|jgi:riboflavin synthase